MEQVLKTNEDILKVQKELLVICQQLPEKCFVCKIEPFYKKRSLSINSYFHVLIDKISKKINRSADDIKTEMNLDYGTIAEDEKGLKVGFEARADVPITNFFKYAKEIGRTRKEDGKIFKQYIIYKETHTLNDKEMTELVKGVIEEAKQLDIETLTPRELEALKGYEEN
jgi:hypothetical protein